MKNLLRSIVAIVASIAMPAFGFIGGREVASTDRQFDGVCGFSQTQWQDLSTVFGTGFLVAKDRVMIPRHLINQNYIYGGVIAPDPSPDLYFVRFRRNVNGSLGQSEQPDTMFDVAIKDWIFTRGKGVEEDICVALLAKPVTHIAVVAMNFDTMLTRQQKVQVAGWGPQQSGNIQPDSANARASRLRIGEMRISSADRTTFGISSTSQTGDQNVQIVQNDSGSVIFINTRLGARAVGFVTQTNGGVMLNLYKGNANFFKALDPRQLQRDIKTERKEEVAATPETAEQTTSVGSAGKRKPVTTTVRRSGLFR